MTDQPDDLDNYVAEQMSDPEFTAAYHTAAGRATMKQEVINYLDRRGYHILAQGVRDL